ncbi:MAG: ISL3 family transposase [Acidobacteria bacterium]|nr:MAG: ISL3 family transposase [Acidobacteriota bacterium]
MDVTTLLADPAALHLECFVSEPKSITLVLHAVQSAPRCPGCNQPSHSLHSHYGRAVADLPWHGVAIKLRLQTRKFRCCNQLCEQKVFCERLPQVVDVYARKTVRLNAALTLLAFSLGGEPGARTACGLGLTVSGDTLLRRIRRTPVTELTSPRVLGVDDWAKRKGYTYGTILVDLGRRCPVDLLPDREAGTLSAWLTARPGIEIITRDRSPSYANAISAGAPEALQVADRWHLLHNLGQAVEKVMARKHRFIKQACALKGDDAEVTQDIEHLLEQVESQMTTAQKRQAVSRQRRYDLYCRIKQLSRGHLSINAIARSLGINYRTASKYAKADSFPERAKRNQRPGVIAPFIPYLRKRWAEGCRSFKQLLEEIKARGYRHKLTPLWRLTLAWRAAEPSQLPRKRLPLDVQPLPPLIKPLAAAWLLQKEAAKLKPEETLYLA